MGYVEDMGRRGGEAALRSLSVRVLVALRRGALAGHLAPIPLEVGESVADCCARAAAEARIAPRLEPVACVAVQSDPAPAIAGPGRLRRQDIEVSVWAAPAGPIEPSAAGCRRSPPPGNDWKRSAARAVRPPTLRPGPRCPTATRRTPTGAFCAAVWPLV